MFRNSKPLFFLNVLSLDHCMFRGSFDRSFSACNLSEKKDPIKYAKKKDSLVQKNQANRVILKLIALICLPLTFGFMYAEHTTAMFAFFLIGTAGILYSDVVLIFSAVLGISIPFQALCLSEKHRLAMRILTWISIFFEVFLLVFFLLHFSEIAWFSPGFYTLIYLDVQILKSSKLKRSD